MTWVFGAVQAYGQRKSPHWDAWFFLLLFQDLVTASIPIEPGGFNYDLDTWGCAGLRPTQIPLRECLVFFYCSRTWLLLQ